MDYLKEELTEVLNNLNQAKTGLINATRANTNPDLDYTLVSVLDLVLKARKQLNDL